MTVRCLTCRRPSCWCKEIDATYPLVRSVALRYQAPELPVEELEAVGWLAVARALRTYDPERGPFVPYARPWVRSYIHRFAAANVSSSFLLPERVWNAVIGARRSVREVERDLGRTPTDDDLCAAGLDPLRLRSLIALGDRPVALDRPVGDSGLTARDMIASAARTDRGDEGSPELEHILCALPRDWGDALRLYYGLDGEPWDLEDIAHVVLFVAPSEASSILDKALKRLRALNDAEEMARARMI